jgi:sialidase-1
MSFAAEGADSASIKEFMGEGQFEIQQVFESGRLPNVIVTMDGTVVIVHGAFDGKQKQWWDKGVQVRRSEDAGKTWGEPITVANPGWNAGGAIVDERSGDILVFVEQFVWPHPPTEQAMYRSNDDGKTWKKELPVIKLDSKGHAPSLHMAEHGITLQRGKHKGRLLRPARYFGPGGDLRKNYPITYNTAIYSDDSGKTWQTSEPFPEMGTGEGVVAELSDGRIYYNSRRHWDPPDSKYDKSMRWSACSSDGGATWKDPMISKVLPDGARGSIGGGSGCMAGLVRLPVKGRDILLYSNCDSENGDRKNVSVWASFDGAKTWPIKQRIFNGPSAYSSLNVGRPGTVSEGWIYIQFEAGKKHRYQGAQSARFNLTWLLEGEQTEDGELPKWLGAVEPLIPVGLQKQLLVDDYVIAEKQNVTRALGKVKKIGVVLRPSLDTDSHPSWKKPDGSKVALDFGYYLSVARNERRKVFQMWYMAWRLAGVGYAESKDGIHWTRPLVGKDGKNNIVHLSQGFSCTIDPTLPWGHAEKYKAAFDDNRDRVCQAVPAYSSDGIHWSSYNNGKHVTHRAADTQNQLLWDPIAKRYSLLTRTDLGGHGGTAESRSQRIMGHTENNNLLKHPSAWKIIADKIKVDDPRKEKNQWGKPRLQFNSMTLWIHEGIYFGLMDVYTMGKSRFFDGYDYKTKHNDDFMDFYIGTSRDGISFDKNWVHNRRAFVPRGPARSFDKDGIKPPTEIVTYNDEHWIYYGGMDERHYSKGRHLNIGLAKLRLDRFMCLEAKDRPGTIITKPFKLEGNKLEVNIDARDGWVQIDLLDENGKAISGGQAKRYENADELRLTPKWKNQADLSSLKGEELSLRFTMKNAKLYAFQFQ